MSDESEATARTVEANGCRIRYHDVGAGPPVLCMHGGGPGATGWSNFSRNVPELSKHFRLLIADFPGFGGSTAPPSVPSPLEFFAETMVALLDALGIERCHIIGNSTGGGTGLRIAIDHPGRVDKLVLMGSAGYGPSAFTPTPPEGIKAIRSYYPDPSLEKMRALIRTFVWDPDFPDLDRIVRERYEASIRPGIEEAFHARGKHIAMVGELHKVQAPTLLLWGREDRFVGLDHALGFLAGIPEARLVVYAKCGHWVQAEKQAEFDREVVGFLS